MEIKVNVDIKAVSKALGDLKNQIPFAISTAVNDVAKKAQTDIRSHIHEKFIVRRPAWIDRSVKIAPFANKQTLSATISIDPAGGNDVLSKFEEGGTKTSQRGGLVAIPGREVFPDKSKVIPKGKRPRNLKAFVLKTKSGGEALMTYVGRGKNRIVKLAYALVKSVPIPKKLDFVKTATATVNREWEASINRAVQKAIDTAWK